MMPTDMPNGVHIRPAREDDLAVLAAVAAPLQADPARFQAYFGSEPDEIAAEIAEVPEWCPHTVVAELDGRVVGWLLAEHDDEIGRVWWWGPVVADHGVPGDWTALASRLLESAADTMLDTGLGDGRFDQFEFAVDARHDAAIALALDRGYHRDTGSVLLALEADVGLAESTANEDGDQTAEITADLAGHHRDEVATLHDAVFPTAHLTGGQVVDSAADDVVLAAVEAATGAVVGYVRAEVQPGGGGYLDFLGVNPAARSAGIGGRLVAAAVREVRARGAGTVSLTVREDNSAARALYRRLGFDGDRVLVPLRLGFSTSG